MRSSVERGLTLGQRRKGLPDHLVLPWVLHVHTLPEILALDSGESMAETLLADDADEDVELPSHAPQTAPSAPEVDGGCEDSVVQTL